MNRRPLCHPTKSAKGKEGLCTACYQAQWYAKHHDKVEMTRRWNLYARFRMTTQDYDKLLAEQNGCCAICERPPQSRRLAIDHSHKTGRARGLLCAPCNRTLGYIEHATWLTAAKRYLQQWSC